MSLSKQTRSAPQKNSCSCTAIPLPPSCLGGAHSLTKWFLLCLFMYLLVPVKGISLAVSSERLTCSHIPRGARCGCVPSKAQGHLHRDKQTRVSPAQPAQAAKVPLHPCWVQRCSSAQGTATHLVEFTASPESASLHFSRAYLRLCLTRHMWAWQPWWVM